MAPGWLGDLNFLWQCLIFVSLSVEPVFCHPSGTKDFERAVGFLENMCTPEINTVTVK